MPIKSNEAFLKTADKADLPYLFKSDRLAEGGLLCAQILRWLPGKRLVCQAEYAGQDVLVKIFFGDGYSRRWQREISGITYLANASVKTPKLIESAQDEVQGIAFAIFDYIEQAETLEEKRQKTDTADAKQALLKRALSPIAKLHDASVYQQDIHLDNFLVSKESLYLIDGDQVIQNKGSAALAAKLATDNLAIFFTQLYPWEDEQISPLLDHYCSLRPKIGKEINLQAVKQQLIKRREWRERKFLEKKIFRVCSDFNVIKNWKSYCVFSREIGEDAARAFIAEPDRFIEQGKILKNGRTATVAKIDFAGKAYVVKRYNKKSSYHRLARSLKESRAAVSWRNGHLLRFNGIPTAPPVLMLEQRLGGVRFGAYVITEFIPGEHAANYFSRDDQSDAAKAVAAKIARVISKLHQSRLTHGDLKSHNIWIVEGDPILIDLDGMRKHKSTEQQREYVQKDWSRLRQDLGQSAIALILFKMVENIGSK